MQQDLILKFKRKERFQEILLLFSAMGINFEVITKNGIKYIIVPEEDKKKALNQILLYRKENKRIKEKSIEEPFNYIAYYSIVFVFFMFYFFQMFERVFYTDLNLLMLGSLDVEKVRSGEFYRTVTAITLHSDFIHILSNALFGGFIFYFLFKKVGVGVGWFIVLLSGIAGNILSSFIEPAGFVSIGSSTICFGGLGILTSQRIFNKDYFNFNNAFIPFLAALAILGLFGTSYGSDIFGHLFGFLAGMILGFLLVFMEKFYFVKSKIFNIISGLLSIILVLLSWVIAIKKIFP
ncbi:MAG: rhomboid family intramembrane serine protease [Brevinematales bacterium]|nr:rhomboid family intramembrane serine protease [Brevinematales bacterium]